MFVHPNPIAKLTGHGNIHIEGGRVIVGDSDIMAKLAAQLGITRGGQRDVKIDVVVYAITEEMISNDSTLGGTFAEGSEP